VQAAPLLDPQEQQRDCVAQLQTPQHTHFRKLDLASKAGNDALAIAVGETLCLDAAIAGERVVNFRLVGADFPKKQTMRVALTKTKGGYKLVLFNPTPKWLRYRAWVTPSSSDEAQAQPTGVFPVAPGLAMVQFWAPATDMGGLVLDSFELHEQAGNGPARPAPPVASGGRPVPDDNCVPQMNVPPEKHFGKQADSVPGISNDSFVVGLGETLCLDATESGGRLVDFRIVGPDFPKARTMKVQFTQMQGSYVLMVKNPTARILRYRVALLLPAADGSVHGAETDVLPVPPGLLNFESWPATRELAGAGLHHLELAPSSP
jgi:hypothetical protein